MINAVKAFLYNLYQTWSYASGRAKHYHTGERKPAGRIWRELTHWWINEREFNTMYYAMGLNLKGTDSKDFISRRQFLKIKNKVENKLKKKYGCSELDYDVVCKDKFVADSFFKTNNIPVVGNLALIKEYCVYWKDADPEGPESILKKDGKYILKHITLEAGDGTYCLEVEDKTLKVDGKVTNKHQLNELLKSGIWVLQNFLISHEAIRKVNNSALNTTRIMTILKDGEPQYLAGFQAFAVNNENTDSWSKGSVYVGLDIEKECLLEDGFYNLSIRDKSLVKEHPDSKVSFKDYKIPYLKQAVELCCRAHSLLYFNFMIGWDVAITVNGPIIIEANEKPGMNVVQCFNGGLKQQIMTSANQILSSGQEF